MPNWCSNSLEVKATPGDEKSIVQLNDFMHKIHAAAASDRGIFSQFFPCPQELYDNPGDGFSTWHKWHVDNWGTKWDVNNRGDNIIFADSEDDFYQEMWFDTAWAPPQKFVESVSKLYPLLTFRLAFSEGGCMFAGTVTVNNGEVLGETKVKVEWKDDPDTADEDDYEGPDPCEEWQEFMNQHGLHTGG